MCWCERGYWHGTACMPVRHFFTRSSLYTVGGHGEIGALAQGANCRAQLGVGFGAQLVLCEGTFWISLGREIPRRQGTCHRARPGSRAYLLYAEKAGAARVA